MISPSESPTQSRKIPNYFVWIFLVLSALGFLDATYLTVKHYLGTPLTCAIFTGCEQVTTSIYSTVAGVPVALFGALYYLALLILIVAYIDTRREVLIEWAAKATILGFLASTVLMGLQFFVIQALCLYCVISATTSTLLFIAGQWFLYTKKNLFVTTSAYE